MKRLVWLFSKLAGFALVASLWPRATAQELAPGSVWRCTLTDGSEMLDDCPVCDRVTRPEPLRGTFELRLAEAGLLFSRYAFENIQFTNVPIADRTYKFTGRGIYQVGGEVALQQSAWLELSVDDGTTNELCLFTNASSAVTRRWPMLQVSLVQSNGNDNRTYHLLLNTAPMREIWFSTAQNLVAGIWQPPTNTVSQGSMVAAPARRVKLNQQLTAHLGIMPVVPDLGLKDFEILAGGEIAFSIETEAWSESLGQLIRAGDIVSSKGLVLRTNRDLLAAFAPDAPSAAGVGLAALKRVGTGETWFSVQTNFYSQSLRTRISSGDLLSDSGNIIRRNSQLTGRFGPVAPGYDAGLKAVYVWPSGEIWFCTATGFDGAAATHYDAGDLLSEEGYVVFRNSELLSSFQPMSGTTTATVDGLFVVTDAVHERPAPALRAWMTNQPPSSLALEWAGAGQVFQLERAVGVAGQYVPVGPITPDSLAIDGGALTNRAAGFYRVRQW
jgi:hypothetical protein